jgi:hypothetical protein
MWERRSIAASLLMSFFFFVALLRYLFVIMSFVLIKIFFDNVRAGLPAHRNLGEGVDPPVD